MVYISHVFPRARAGYESIAARILRKIEVLPSGCWRWTGKLDRNGYPTIRIRRPDGSIAERIASRVSYEVFVAEILPKLDADHLCRLRSCVNPACLEPVTHRVNLLRGQTLAAHNSNKTHCVAGHEFTPENTYVYRWKRSSIRRVCRACDRSRQRRRVRRVSVE